MSEEKVVWWKRFGLWLVAGVSAAVLFVLAAGRKSPPIVPPVVPVPPPPSLPTVVVPPVNTNPLGGYVEEKVVPNGAPSRTKIARILLRLQSNDDKKG